jgi:uncharacterized membrane protein YdbT with pleckstrin-like domain
MAQHSPHSERIIFHGTPSHWLNFDAYVKAAVAMSIAFSAPRIWDGFIALFVSKDLLYLRAYYIAAFKAVFFLAPAYAFSVWLKTYFHRYTVTTERISEGKGIFSRNTEELELYRVKDIRLSEPFSLRMFGCSDLVLTTSDKTTPVVVIHGISNGRDLLNKIRAQVEIMRARKGVREID